jgi:hypothetical protein
MESNSNIIVVDIRVEDNRLDSNLRSYIEDEVKRILINRIYNTMVIKDIKVLNEITPRNCNTMNIGVKVEVLDSIRYERGDVVEGVLNLEKNPIRFYSGNLDCTFTENSYTREMTCIKGKDGIKYSNGDTCKVIINNLKYIHGNIYIQGSVDLFSKYDKKEDISIVNNIKTLTQR